MTPTGELSGMLHQTWTTRRPKPEGKTRTQMRLRDKESDLWPNTVVATGALGPTKRAVHVCDCGGNTFDMMVHCRNHNACFLIRSQKDRRLHGHADKLCSFINRQPSAGHRAVLVPARDGRSGRVARLSIRIGSVWLSPPQGDPRFKEPLAVSVVQAVELEPPIGSEPVEWILLTSEVADDFAQSCEWVDWYASRWLIEEWHTVEKAGCDLEASQLRDAHALSRLAAFVLVRAVRILQMRDLVRELSAQNEDAPPLPANQPAEHAALAPIMWRVHVARKACCPVNELTPRLFWPTIANKGGWLSRKSDRPPGWQTIWSGWLDFLLMVFGAELCRDDPLAENQSYGNAQGLRPALRMAFRRCHIRPPMAGSVLSAFSKKSARSKRNARRSLSHNDLRRNRPRRMNPRSWSKSQLYEEMRGRNRLTFRSQCRNRLRLETRSNKLAQAQPKAASEQLCSRPDYALFKRLNSRRGEGRELGAEVFGTTIEGGQPGIIFLGDFDFVPFAKFHHDVEKVHRIQIELVAKPNVRIDIGQVRVGGDDGDNPENDVFSLFVCHVSSSAYFSAAYPIQFTCSSQLDLAARQSPLRRSRFRSARGPFYSRYFLTTTAEFMPNMPNELLRITATRPASRGRFITRFLTAHRESNSSTLIVG